MTNLLLPQEKTLSSIEEGFPHHKTSAANRIENIILQVAAIEFLVAAGTCFLASVLYFGVVLTAAPSPIEYIGAALGVALLLLMAAIGFKQYNGIQTQPRDRYMSSGLGAVTQVKEKDARVTRVGRILRWTNVDELPQLSTY